MTAFTVAAQNDTFITLCKGLFKHKWPVYTFKRLCVCVSVRMYVCGLYYVKNPVIFQFLHQNRPSQTNIYTFWKQATVIEQGYLCVHVSVRVMRVLFYRGTHVKRSFFLSQTCGSYQTVTV